MAEIAAEYAPMMAWVVAKGFPPAVQAKFATDADGWLVATAKRRDFCLVTHERRQADVKSRVLMPNLSAKPLAWAIATPLRCCGSSAADTNRSHPAPHTSRSLHDGPHFMLARTACHAPKRREMWPFKKVTAMAGGDPSPEATLKENVTAFWSWFATNAGRFYQTIEDKRCGDLTEEVSTAVDRWLPGMAWVFGPGPGGAGHSFTLSGEGVRTLQFVAEYWCARAPVLDHWTFYSARQASDHVENFSIKIAGDPFDSAQVWIATYVDTQEEKIDLMVWHPLFPKLDEGMRMRVLFLLLDEVLGEHGTQNWIGEIKTGDTRLKESFPVAELREMIAKVQAEHGWEKLKPTEAATSYSRKEPGNNYPRADVFVGTTRNFPLIREHGAAEGRLVHPLPGLGVELAYVCLSRGCLPVGEEVDFRSDVEDALAEALKQRQEGDTFGGAMGAEWAYIDLMLYDGRRSLDTVLKVLRRRRLPKDTHVRWFTADKADVVVELGG